MMRGEYGSSSKGRENVTIYSNQLYIFDYILKINCIWISLGDRIKCDCCQNSFISPVHHDDGAPLLLLYDMIVLEDISIEDNTYLCIKTRVYTLQHINMQLRSGTPSSPHVPGDNKGVVGQGITRNIPLQSDKERPWEWCSRAPQLRRTYISRSHHNLFDTPSRTAAENNTHTISMMKILSLRIYPFQRFRTSPPVLPPPEPST